MSGELMRPQTSVCKRRYLAMSPRRSMWILLASWFVCTYTLWIVLAVFFHCCIIIGRPPVRFRKRNMSLKHGTRFGMIPWHGARAQKRWLQHYSELRTQLQHDKARGRLVGHTGQKSPGPTTNSRRVVYEAVEGLLGKSASSRPTSDSWRKNDLGFSRVLVVFPT